MSHPNSPSGNNLLQEKLVTKIGKLLSERPSKSSGYSRAYVYEPADFFEKQYGTLFFVIEIASPDPQVIEVGDLIIEVIKEEYYADLDRDSLVSFETSLKVANRELGALAAQGKTAWVNKINAICACLSGKMLHLTQVGSAEAYLLRHDNLTHISENLYRPSEKPNPFKTFLNISSGELKAEDRLLISTPGLFYTLSLDTIKKIISDPSPTKAVKRLAEILKEEEDALGTSLLVIRVTTEEKISQETIEEEEEEIWIAEPKSKLASLKEKTQPVLKRSKEILDSKLKGTKIKAKKTLLPLWSKATTKLKTIKNQGLKTPPAAASISKAEPPQSALPSSAGQAPSTVSEEPTPESSRPEISEEKISWKQKIKNYFSRLGSVKKIATGISKDISEKEKPLTQDKYFYLTIIALIIFSISVGLFIYQRKVNQEFNRAKNIYEGALEKEQKAEAMLIYHDRQNAKKLLQEAQEELNAIRDNKAYQKKVADLMAKIKTQLDKANLIYRLTQPYLAAHFTGENVKTYSLFVIGNDFYSFQEKGKTVYRYQAKEKKTTRINKTLTRGNFVAATLTGDNTILLYDDGPGVSEYNPLENSLIPQTIALGGSWEKGIACATYRNYLYVLAPSVNKIYRHAKTLGGFSVGVDYLENTNLNLSSAISLAINETIFVLKSNGEILQFSQGRQIPFVIKNLPAPLQQPLFLFTQPGLNYLYLATKNGIIVFDLNGNYQGQYIAEPFKEIKGLFVDEQSQKIYVLSENKVYSFPMAKED